MDKGLFYSGLGIFVMEILGAGIYFISKSGISISGDTLNMIVGAILLGSLSILSLTLMIVGAAKKE